MRIHYASLLASGVCRSGSKAGSQKYKLAASTSHQYCPRLRKLVPDSKVPEGVHCIYEIVINGLTIETVKKAMSEGIKAAVQVRGVVMISAGNYGGKLGPYQADLKKVLGLQVLFAFDYLYVGKGSAERENY